MISAFELMHRQGFDFLAETVPDVRQPFDDAARMVRADRARPGARAGPARGAGGRCSTTALEAGLVSDGVIAQIGGAARRISGPCAKHDPRGQPPDRVGRRATTSRCRLARSPSSSRARRRGWRRSATSASTALAMSATATCITTSFPLPGADPRRPRGRARRGSSACVHDLVDALGGSVSAEHGIGRLKVDDLERYGDPAKLAAMRAIKAALDPNGIMNPGAVLRPAERGACRQVSRFRRIVG